MGCEQNRGLSKVNPVAVAFYPDFINRGINFTSVIIFRSCRSLCKIFCGLMLKVSASDPKIGWRWIWYPELTNRRLLFCSERPAGNAAWLFWMRIVIYRHHKRAPLRPQTSCHFDVCSIALPKFWIPYMVFYALGLQLLLFTSDQFSSGVYERNDRQLAAQSALGY